MITNQKELRRLFWEQHPQLAHLHKRTVSYGAGHKDYSTDVRVAFVDWTDGLRRGGQLSERLAYRATL